MMATHAARTPVALVAVDPALPAAAQAQPLHNRWHPDIPPVATTATDVAVRLESVDWTGGQIGNNDCADDVRDVDLTRCHHLTGPIRVCDKETSAPAAPGDLLVVEILDIAPLKGYEWGYTGIFDPANGGGFLTEDFPEAGKAIWDLEGRTCTSRHIPGVSFAGLIHPGLIGTAPSQELLDIWNKREAALVAEGSPNEANMHTRPLALLPEPKNALLGSVRAGDERFDKMAAEAARTIPGREHGGNCDIKNLTIGTKCYFPVFVEGANLSFGDIHASQGDGEISFCGAIEVAAAYMTVKMNIIRGGIGKYLSPVGPSPLNVYPIFEISPLAANNYYTEFLVFEGQSVDASGKQHFLDASVSFKMACNNAVNYLSKFGYTRAQVYLLLSCCPCEGRVSGIVDIPNCCTTLAIPTRIFDQDIRPKPGGPPTGVQLITRGDVARPST